MKNSIRILGATVLLAIYCFAISVVTTSLSRSQFQKIDQDKYFSNVTSNLYFHTSPSESSVNNFTNFASPVFKNVYTGLWAIVKAIEHVSEAEFSQYTITSGNFLINYRKSDIIFPFHYFW